MNRQKSIILITIIQLVLVTVFAMPARAEDNGIISGAVYHDVNGNGQPEIGEPNIADAVVYLQRVGDSAPITVVTDAEGYFVVTDLPYGAYEIWAADADLNLSTVQAIEIDEVNGASSIELPIVYDMSDDVEFMTVTINNIFLPFVNR